jgi:hypothetical protein
MKVYLHTRKPGDTDWENTLEDFEQIPRVGDIVSRKAGDDPWHQVELVVWIAEGTTADCQVELYAVTTDHMKVRQHSQRTSDMAHGRGEI